MLIHAYITVALLFLVTRTLAHRSAGITVRPSFREESIVSRTYIPSAWDIANRLHKYLTRYNSTLQAGLTPTQVTALANLIACLATFLAEVSKPPPV